MDYTQPKNLCLSLMEADTEQEVITLFKEAGYWENPAFWRFYGDYENNFNTIGNQQSRPDSALVEHLVNSIDARLVNECAVRGIDPEGPVAPRTIHQAVAMFFEEGANPNSVIAGRVREWQESKRTDIARGITLAATGHRAEGGGYPCFTISDCGEGQTPDMMPETLLSLTRANRLRVPFVQGKFNMGRSGVLKFSGHHNLQLVLSRRNPAIINRVCAEEADYQWGFTVVRREDPQGNRRSSVYTYLAPVGAQAAPKRGGVLRFSARSMPIFPEGRDAYRRDSEWGTLVKLYEYSASKSHILRKDGILSRVDLLLPDVALPIRLHECREGYKGHLGSFETTLTGVAVRLEDDKGRNLEEGFPCSFLITAAGEEMRGTIYAFKKGRAETYRKNEGIIFTINGQTHGHLTADFFRRQSVGLSYLADSILIIAECGNLSGRAREDIFMNSRDRLRHGDLTREIEQELESQLKHHQGLRQLKERRRREETESKRGDDKPLRDVLQSLIKRSPSLTALFLQGPHISNPFKTIQVREGDTPFQGKRYPTYFKFKGKDYGVVLHRDCHINHRRFRITFETDAANDYFSRPVEPGEMSLEIVSGVSRSPVENHSTNLQNGIATLSVQLPANCREGDELHFTAIVNDPSQVRPFENSFAVNVKGVHESYSVEGKRRKPLAEGAGKDREAISGLALPKVKDVPEAEWENYNPPFDKYTALRIRHAGAMSENGENQDMQHVYDFFINMDNVFLKSELKLGKNSPEAAHTRFKYGMVLLALALVHQDVQRTETRVNNGGSEDNKQEENIEDKVEEFSKAVAPFLLPIIESLGAIDLEDTSVSGACGEDA